MPTADTPDLTPERFVGRIVETIRDHFEREKVVILGCASRIGLRPLVAELEAVFAAARDRDRLAADVHRLFDHLNDRHGVNDPEADTVTSAIGLIDRLAAELAEAKRETTLTAKESDALERYTQKDGSNFWYPDQERDRRTLASLAVRLTAVQLASRTSAGSESNT